MNFLSVQVDYWDSPWQNRHAFVWELSKTNPVFFLSPPFSLPEVVDPFFPKRTRMKSGLRQIKQGLFSYVPPRYLPSNHRFPRLNKKADELRTRKIRSVLAKENFGKPILIVWHPSFAHMIGRFDESFVVYYKYDNYQGYFGAGKGSDPKEQELISRADLMLVTSEGLYGMHKGNSTKLSVLPNGVDYEFFSQTLTDVVTIPEELAQIPRPRIGYVGVVNEKVDFKLLTHICKQRPDWSVVLVGPEKVRRAEFRSDFERFAECNNAYLLGRKEGRQVPAYIKGMDVCMMCYVVNDWTYYGYPLKMHEYLACGKPSVSADLPAVREFSSVVTIPNSYDEWVQAIAESLERQCDVEARASRLAVAQANSWAARVEKFMTLIAQTKSDTA